MIQHPHWRSLAAAVCNLICWQLAKQTEASTIMCNEHGECVGEEEMWNVAQSKSSRIILLVSLKREKVTTRSRAAEIVP